MASRRIIPALFALFLLGGCNRQQQQFRTAAQLTGGGDAQAGMSDLRKYGCGGCHTIPASKEPVDWLDHR
jgi:hypothetical protein